MPHTNCNPPIARVASTAWTRGGPIIAGSPVHRMVAMTNSTLVGTKLVLSALERLHRNGHAPSSDNLDEDWSIFGPEYYRVDLDTGNTLIFSRITDDKYIVTVTDGEHVGSAVVTDASIENVTTIFDQLRIEQQPSGSKMAETDEESSNKSAQSKAPPQASTAIGLSSASSGGTASPSVQEPYPSEPGRTRDPNAPPGFEDEFQMNQGQRPSTISPFDRLRDIGSADLHPFGVAPPMQPNTPFLFGPRGGGMHPDMFPGRGAPGIRYDPVNPGDDPTHNAEGRTFRGPHTGAPGQLFNSGGPGSFGGGGSGGFSGPGF